MPRLYVAHVCVLTSLLVEGSRGSTCGLIRAESLMETCNIHYCRGIYSGTPRSEM